MKHLNSNKMGRIAKFLCFVFIFVCCFIFISYVFRPEGDEEIGFKGFYFEKRNTLAVVYVGGSVCINGWVPYTAWQEQGVASFALGKNTLYSFCVLPLMKEVMKYQSPEVFVIDLRPFEYTGTGRSISKNIILPIADSMPALSINRLDILWKGYQYCIDLDENDTLLTYFVDLVRYHGRWKDFTFEFFRYAIPGQHTNNTKGHWLVTSVKGIKLTDNSKIVDTLPVGEFCVNDLEEVMTYLRAKNKKAVFVIAPYQETVEERERYNYLSGIITEGGFDYVNANDYYDDMSIDETRDFYNANHMNIFGAEKYTSFLSRYLVSHYDLKDKRLDKSYVIWNSGYLLWEEQLKEVKGIIEDILAETSATN